MIKIDRYLDTKEKRKCLLHILYLLVTIVIIYAYLKTAMVLLSIQSYDALFSALANATLDESYLARVVLSSMSMSEFSIIRLCMNMISSCSLLDIIWIGFTFMVLCSDVYRDVRREYCIIFISYIATFTLIGIIAILATQATSLLSVVRSIHIIAWILIVSQIILFIVCFLWLFKEMQEYHLALSYNAIEIID